MRNVEVYCLGPQGLVKAGIEIHNLAVKVKILLTCLNNSQDLIKIQKLEIHC